MKLYIVDYEYYDTYEKTNEKDRWFFGYKDHIELEEAIEKKIKKFKRYGYEITKHSYRMVSVTDNHKAILIK